MVGTVGRVNGFKYLGSIPDNKYDDYMEIKSHVGQTKAMRYTVCHRAL